MTSKTRPWFVIVGAAVAIALVLVLPRLLFRDASFSLDPVPPGVVFAERVSPDSQLVAAVTALGDDGRYLLTLKDSRTQVVVVSREVSVTLGYHQPIIKLEWAPDGSRVTVVIDHDFGDNVVRVPLERPLLPRSRS